MAEEGAGAKAQSGVCCATGEKKAQLEERHKASKRSSVTEGMGRKFVIFL